MTTPSKISEKVDVHSLPDLTLKAYWVLDKLSTATKDRFTATEIAHYLVEKAGISTYAQAVEYSLKKYKAACDKNKSGYKLMKGGKDELQKHSVLRGIVFVDANKPFSSKNYTLNEILRDNYSELAICDPYVDHNTIDVIFKNFKKKSLIRVLTSRIIDKPIGMLKRQLQDLKTEGFNVEIRIYGSSTLHDRYIINEKNIWFSGNSLNFLGTKESFLILLGEDTRQSILAMFNSRWKSATPY